MRKIKNYLFLVFFFTLPAASLAADMEALKVDFLQGNYRRVIFEAKAQADGVNVANTDELNYILGLSYLKENNTELAQGCFRRILNSQKSKFKEQATLGLADAFLLGAKFNEAEEIYNKLILDEPDSKFKAALLYRLSQLELKRGNSQEANALLLKLKKEFPLSPDLKAGRGIELISRVRPSILEKDTGAYSVQVGFFSNSVNANNLKDKLQSMGYPAYMEASGSGYRIRVGKFKTLREAQELDSKLSKDDFQTKICP